VLRRARLSPTLRALTAPLRAVRRWAIAARRRPDLRAYRKLGKLLGEDPVVRLPEFDGAFQMDVRSHIFQRCLIDGTYEPELAALCRTYLAPDRDAIDVGANVGFYSVLFGRLLQEGTGRVVSVEPSPDVLVRLRANLARNGVADRVTVFAGAMADRKQMAHLQRLAGFDEYATIGASMHHALDREQEEAPGKTERIAVAAESLDGLVEAHGLRPGFIKIDVEGAEHLVIRGAVETLRVHRPVLMLEVVPALLQRNGTSAEEVFRLLHEAGYDLRSAYFPSEPADPREPAEVLALPRERRS